MSATQGAAVVVRRHLELALSVHSAAVLALLSFNKLTSVIIKVFSEIAVHGFCPVKELDEEGAKVDEELKSSEKETGLGQGEGAKDNEDMLDGAYQNPEDGQDKEEKDNKEDTGIEMSGNFDRKLQDKKEEEDKEGELEDETRDVEGNEDLDKDKLGEEEDDKADKAGVEDSEEHRAEEENMEELAAKEDKEKNSKEEEKREHKEEEKEKDDEAQEFDDHQVDPYQGDDQQLPESRGYETSS